MSHKHPLPYILAALIAAIVLTLGPLAPTLSRGAQTAAVVGLVLLLIVAGFAALCVTAPFEENA